MRKYGSNVAFLDLLFLQVLGLTFLFFLSLILINPPANKAEIPRKAEYLITLEWPDGFHSDIDLWMLGPSKTPVGWKNHQAGLLHYERDDFGSEGDVMIVRGEKVINPNNSETIVMRGIAAGDYRVSVHLYKMYDDTPPPVTVKVMRVNPYQVIYSQTVVLEHQNQIHDFYTFSLNDEGEVTDIWRGIVSAVPNMRDSP